MSRLIIIALTALCCALIIKPAYRMGQRVGMLICRFLDWRDDRRAAKQLERAIGWTVNQTLPR